MFYLLLLPIVTCLASEVMLREKRQTYYYICGTYPNQFYSLYPCTYYPGSGTTCSGGGTKLMVGCYTSAQCTAYTSEPVRCENGCCCTIPGSATTQAPLSSLGFCASGQRSGVRCSANSGCAAGQTCLNGLCCTTTGNEWQTACAGLGALASCSNGACGAFHCTTSNYCCECPVGRTSGLCTNGCGAGYTCSSSGYCCPQCPGGVAPYGSCYNGQCAQGYTCRAGNICCL